MIERTIERIARYRLDEDVRVWTPRHLESFIGRG
jgi:hypothetical protein